MALRVNYNFQSDFAHVNLKKNENALNTSIERLSTGLRINSAKDDAAGLFIADQLNLVGKALDQGSRNANDGISAAQIAESTLGQIYDKLTSMYAKASQAATDTNDRNSREALQRDIEAITDAIDRMASATEFNGRKLLDGSFTNEKIQYGPRAGQSLGITLDGATAKDLGAYAVRGEGSVGKSATQGYATLTDGGTNFGVSSADTLKIAGQDVTSGLKVDDAQVLASNINLNSALQELGIEASAVNESIADAEFGVIKASGGNTTIKFFIGTDRNEDITVTVKDGEQLTLNDLVTQINAQAGGEITAKNIDGKLFLSTSGDKEGATIGVEVTTGSDAADFDLGTLIQGAGGTNVAGGKTGSAVKVGKIDITGLDSFKIEHKGVSDSDKGFAFDVDNNKASKLHNLNSLDVTSYSDAQFAMKVLDVAIKKVDKNRSELGSIQQNLQAIVDNNNFAATQTREAESRIRNVDFAKEMSEFTRKQTLMQSGMAMLAQANQLPQMVLQLLR